MRTDADMHMPVWGFNSAYLFDHATGEEPALRSMITDMGIQVIRFPGGTLANFHHPGGAGYGLRTSDAELVKGTGMYKAIARAAEREQTMTRAAGDDNVHRMIELANAIHVKVLYVANLFSAEDEETIAVLHRLKDGGVDVIGIELGCEYYLKAYQAKYPGIQAYITRVKSIAPKLKAEFPDLPIGIVAAPPAGLKGGKDNPKLEAWNDAVANSPYVDALILHTYSFPNECAKEGSDEAIFTCMNASSADYVDTRLPAALRRLSAQTGGKKSFWITEWNLQGVFAHFGNTLLQGIFATDMMFTFSDDPDVSISICHNLLATGEGYNAIRIEGGSGFDPQVLYHVNSMLKDVFVPGSKVTDLPVTGGGEVSSHVRLVKTGTGANFLVITARGGSQLSLAGIQLPAGIPASGTATILGSSHLMDKVGSALRPVKTAVSDVHELVLPDYAVAVVRLGE